MSDEQPSLKEDAAPAAAGGWTSLLAWFLPALIISAGIARLSVTIQVREHAPLVVFPLLLGAVIGGLSSGLLSLANVRRRRVALWGTAALALVVIAAEHYFFYMTRLDELAAASRKAVIPLDDPRLIPTFAEFIQNSASPGRVAQWIVHAVLVTLASVLTVAWRLKSTAARTGAAAKLAPAGARESQPQPLNRNHS